MKISSAISLIPKITALIVIVTIILVLYVVFTAGSFIKENPETVKTVVKAVV